MKLEKIIAHVSLWYNGYSGNSQTISQLYPPSRLKVSLHLTTVFWRRHWQFIITTILAILGTIIGIGVLIIMILDHYKK
jgi:hypothetical protein